MGQQPLRDRPEVLAVGAVAVGAVTVDIFLPLTLLQSGVAVTLLVLVGSAVAIPGVWPAVYRSTGVGRGAWLLALGVAVGGLALTVLVGDPEPFCDGFGHRPCLTTYGLAAAVFLGSTLGVAIGAGHLGRYRRISNAPLQPAAEVSEGFVAVEGRIVPASGTVTGPASDAPAVWYQCVTEQASLFGAHRELDRETAGGEFYVEDGSGRVLVSPDGLDDHDIAELARADTTTGDRQRREWRYEPDDAVTVVGHASEVPGATSPEPVVVGRDGPVLVGVGRQQGALRAWAARRALLGTAIALLVGGPALLVMLLAA